MAASISTRSSSVEAWILWIAAAVALAYLLLPRPYPGDVALKTSMCVLLAIVAFRGGLKLFALALLFSAAGDAFLAYDGQRLFVPGLASFLVTHILYAVVFVLATKGTPRPMTAARKAMLAVIPTFAVVYGAVLWPHLGELAIPVILYIAAIVVMAMLSLRVRAIEVPVGAVLFMASDSLIWMLVLSAPAVITALSVGFIISLFQAVTQIQEQTLVFVPKILAIFLVLLIALPFAGEAMATYMDNVAARIAQP